MLLQLRWAWSGDRNIAERKLAVYRIRATERARYATVLRLRTGKKFGQFLFSLALYGDWKIFTRIIHETIE